MLAAYAFVPGWIGQQRAESHLARVQAADVEQAIDVKSVRTFDVRHETKMGSRTCGKVCVGLIEQGYADWVRVSFAPSKRNGARVAFSFAAATGDICGEKPVCAVAAEAQQDAADLILEHHNERSSALRAGAKRKDLYFPDAMMRTTARQANKKVFSRSDLTYFVAGPRSMLMPNFEGMTCNGYTLAKRKVVADLPGFFEVLRSPGFDLAVPEFKRGGTKKRYQELPTAVEVSHVSRILKKGKTGGCFSRGKPGDFFLDL